MKQEMTVPQLIAALRQRANTYNERADALERDLKIFAFDDEPEPETYIAINSQRAVTVDELKKAMREKKGRIKHFAERLGTTAEIILRIVENPANGITSRNKGWLEVVEPASGNTASEPKEGSE